MPKPGGCPRCGIGVPIAIAQDEAGSTFRCFNCPYQWTVPATAEAIAAEVAGITADTSLADVRALARAKGLEPDEFHTKEALIDAVSASAKQKAKAGEGS